MTLPRAISHPLRLLVDLHVFEPVVRQPVNEEAVHVVAPAGGRAQVGDEDERRGIQVDLLDLRILRLTLLHILLEIGLGDLVVQDVKKRETQYSEIQKIY